MRNCFLKRFLQISSSSRFLNSSRRNKVSAPFIDKEGETAESLRENPGFSYGLNWGLAGKGVIVKDKAFQNLKSSELLAKGATIAETLSGLPLHVRGTLGGNSTISKAQYSKLLKQVTTHISSISNIFVHDGAIGLSPESDAKVRVISDSPSAILSLSRVLWETPTRAVSHDSCPLTVYTATSISTAVEDIIGLGAQGNNGFIAADIERSSLILCGKAFADINGTKLALTALSEPVIFARGGLPLSARLLVSCDSVVLLFAPENAIQSYSDLLVSADAGVVLSPQGVAPLFQTKKLGGINPYRIPSAVILATSDSSGTIPSISKLSPGQAAYHFLAGYQNGEFVPAYYAKGSSYIGVLDLAKTLLSKLKQYQVPTFLVNVDGGVENITDLVKLVTSEKVAPFRLKGGDLQRKYNAFLSYKFQDIPEEFSF
ncbi:uncharacterized protein LOC105792673 isoform X2 [Gossypium raimondii]|uniref:phosphoenolpyruvate carboxykinase (ATP) n=1 Tax=Gossypium raimondii TaxID=29730 RepID=A0A0D2R462_GOSRA|nr:uncharacterized protein LOC105792673 isoform X2 [Gossypium raimondii]KJB26724.1 hypothetical protein B456_004G256700 [Gossypium raimondii]